MTTLEVDCGVWLLVRGIRADEARAREVDQVDQADQADQSELAQTQAVPLRDPDLGRLMARQWSRGGTGCEAFLTNALGACSRVVLSCREDQAGGAEDRLSRRAPFVSAWNES